MVNENKKIAILFKECCYGNVLPKTVKLPTERGRCNGML